MIFVVKSGIKRDAYDTQKLHDKLYKDIKVIIKEIEKG